MIWTNTESATVAENTRDMLMHYYIVRYSKIFYIYDPMWFEKFWTPCDPPVSKILRPKFFS